MKQGRTFETGGEVLEVGSTVIVFDGNSHYEREVFSIGTSRIHIGSTNEGRPVPYSKETRRSLQGAYGSYFRTKREVAEELRRDLAKSRLRDLGFEGRFGGVRDWLEPYSTDSLERITDFIEIENSNSVRSQDS